MANPDLKRVQRLFLFLLITIAIVFFVVATAAYIRRSTEGFQTSDMINSLDYLKTCPATSQCEIQTIGTGTDTTRVYVCRGLDSQENAEKILRCTQPYATTQIQNAPTPFLKLTDGVCYEVYNTKVAGNNYYVCYERPPPLNYDPVTQEVDFNDVSIYGDPVPFALTGDLPLACGLYGTNSATLARNYTSALENYKYVSSSVDILNGTYSTIQGLRTQYCSRQTTLSQSNACRAFTEFGAAADDSNLATLTTIRNSLSNGATEMSNFYTNTLRPSYAGMNCQEPNIQMPF
jgi:hypothetical protein